MAAIKDPFSHLAYNKNFNSTLVHLLLHSKNNLKCCSAFVIILYLRMIVKDCILELITETYEYHQVSLIFHCKHMKTAVHNHSISLLKFS